MRNLLCGFLSAKKVVVEVGLLVGATTLLAVLSLFLFGEKEAAQAEGGAGGVSGSYVYLYEHTDYGGASIAFSQSDPDFTKHQISLLKTWNDQASSIKVPDGYKATLYEHTNYDSSGASKVFTSSNRNFTAISGPSSEKTWNDVASSIKIESTSTPDDDIHIAATCDTSFPEDGFAVCYAGGTDFSGSLLGGGPKVSKIDYDWGDGVVAYNRSDNISARWRGKTQFNGKYRVEGYADNGVIIMVGSNKVIDKLANDGRTWAQYFQSEVFEAVGLQNIQIWWNERDGRAALRVNFVEVVEVAQASYPNGCPTTAYLSGYDYDPYGHPALDLQGGYGHEVRTTMSGTVLVIDGWNGGYGTTVEVRKTISGQNFLVRFAHLVTPPMWGINGVDVKAGDLIGYEDNTGKSTGSHVHYMVEINGVPVNPRQWGCNP